MPDLTQHDIEFHALMNVLYHERAERHSQALLNLTAFLSIVLSSVAFAAATSGLLPVTVYERAIVALATLLVVYLNASVLAFGVVQKHTNHWQFKQKWMALLGDVRKPGKVDLDDLNRRFYAINAQEPAPSRKRLRRAYRDACKRMGLEPETLSHEDEDETLDDEDIN